MQVTTAVTASHLPWARALARSAARADPGAPPVAVLVVDDPAGAVAAAGEPFELLRPADVGLDDAELATRAMIYGPRELAGSTRGLLLRALLERGGPVLFLDADVDVLGSLAPLADQAATAGVVLSPHLVAPPPEPLPVERALLRAGAFNAGYLGVSGERGKAFAEWWAGHLRRECLEAPELGLFLSQRWLDLAPSLFDVAMLRDPGANVTEHNLPGRRVARERGRWTIDRAPLRFLHVSGAFDPRAGSWPLLGTEPAVVALCEDYARRLLEAGHVDPPQPAYRWATSADGIPMAPWVRRRCLAAVHDGEAVPDPFDPATSAAFTAWLAEPVADGVSRWALALRDHRADLRAVFPLVPGPHSGDLLAWLRAQDEVAVPAALAPHT